MPPGGLNIRWPDPPLDQEHRLHRYKLHAALAFARANRLDRIVIDSAAAALRHRHDRQILSRRAPGARRSRHRRGVCRRASACGSTRWRCRGRSNREGVRHFAEGLEEVLVVEEKRAVIETPAQGAALQLAAPTGRPRVFGKFDETGELDLAVERRAVAGADRPRDRPAPRRVSTRSPRLAERARPARRARARSSAATSCRSPARRISAPAARTTPRPGCRRAAARWPGSAATTCRSSWTATTATFTQMGGEGAAWIGQAPFVETPHVFANIGDGTYTHSGILAIRAAVAAEVNMTYKVLFNDAVAMTGGQPLDGGLTVPAVRRAARRRRASGRSSSSPTSPTNTRPAPSSRRARRCATATSSTRCSASCARCRGVTAIVYDQTCAAEKRRRRKRGRFPDPPKRVFINDLVCEGCGDCSTTSNCLSVVPVETEFGRKRAIDQSSCNKDFSCLKGFCPSFVTVQGGSLKKREAGDLGEDELPPLPEPALPALDRAYGILVTGVGGTGVVTIGALLGMAAHLEGKGCRRARHARHGAEGRRGDEPCPHRRSARRDPRRPHRRRQRAPAARLRSRRLRQRRGAVEARRRRHRAIVNSHETITGDFTRNPDLPFPAATCARGVAAAVGPGKPSFSTRRGSRPGSSAIRSRAICSCSAMPISAGLVPVSAAAIERAIELNGGRGRFQPRRLSLGPPRRARSGAGRSARRAAGSRAGKPSPVGDASTRSSRAASHS